MMMSVPPLSHLVYSMACIYLAMVGLVGFTANAFVAFLYCKSKKVRRAFVINQSQSSCVTQLFPGSQRQLILRMMNLSIIFISASHPIQQAADVPDLGGGHHHPVWDTCGLPCQLEHVCSA